MRNTVIKYLCIIVSFLVISYGFVPEVLDGKIVNQSDITGYIGMSHEASTYDKAHPGEPTAWTNSMFGGMPTTMLTGNPGGDATQGIYDAFFVGERPASYLFISLLGAFLLMLSFGINPLLAAAGAVAVTFCSYNFQIIQVGHNAKMVALAWAPWVLAGVTFAYRRALEKDGPDAEGWKKTAGLLAGPVLFGFALNFQIKANHIQISYYLALIIAAYAIVLLVWILTRHKELLKSFFTASALLLALGIVGIGANANRLLPTWEYTKQTMRGGSQLSSPESSGGRSGGLDFKYATQWSYGVEELPNLMVANYNGGSSAMALDPSSSATVEGLKKIGYSRREAAGIAKSLPMYWGPQPFTAGPMYLGAVSIFLFILALGLYRGKEKWWLLIPSVLAIILATGAAYDRPDALSSALRGFNRFWFDNTPFYNKFRTVSMSLVILQFTVPLLGFLVLDRILKGEYRPGEVRKKVLLSACIAGGFCLLLALFPGIAGSFSASVDNGMPEAVKTGLRLDRVAILKKDALVALGLVAATAILILWQNSGKKDSRRLLAEAGIGALALLNLWTTGKRYLNESHFVTKGEFDSHFEMRAADRWILQDEELDYRVVDLSVNTFNDATPSYYHKNIGGYSPVKLQRYQDLIDHYLVAELSAVRRYIQGAETLEEAQEKLGPLPLLSALNCKYIILDGSIPPLQNKGALGNAWLVDSCIVASTPDEEIALLGAVDLAKVAVVPEKTFNVQAGNTSEADFIRLTSYEPNKLVYQSSCTGERLAVFSEIWCPYGWDMTVDGKKVAAPGKADWALRCALIPAGEHEIVMSFDPASYKTGRALSAACSWILILLALGALWPSAEKILRKKA